MERGQWCFASSIPRAWMSIFIQRKQWNSYSDWAQRTKPVRLSSGRCRIHAQVYACHQPWVYILRAQEIVYSVVFLSLWTIPSLLFTSCPPLSATHQFTTSFHLSGAPKGLEAIANQMQCFPKYERAWYIQAAGHQDSTSHMKSPTTAATQRSKQNYSLPPGEGCQSCLISSDLDRARSKKSGSPASWAHAGTMQQWSQGTRTPHP